MSKTIIEALFDYFDKCELMKDSRLNMDYLPEGTKKAGIEYALATSPSDELVYPYKDGGARCRYLFVISSVNDYGPDAAANIANTGFYEKLAAWMRAQTRGRKLPDLPEGLTARGISAIGSGYLYQPNIDAGKYQIQCELDYYRKGDY